MCSVEYGVVTNVWCNEPVDEGTRHVVMNGFQVIVDKKDLFRPVLEQVNKLHE